MKYYYRKKHIMWLLFLFDVIVGSIYKFIRLILFKKPTAFPAIANNILVIRLDHLGDVLYLLPPLAYLRKQYPQAKITLLVAPWGEEIVRGNPNVNEIIVFNTPWFQRGRRKWNWGELWQLILRLRRNKYDLALDFKGFLWNIFFLFATGAKYKISYDDVGGAFLVEKALPRDPTLHILQQNINFLRSIGIDCAGKLVVEVPIRDLHRQKVKEIIETMHFDPKNMIAIHCGSGRPVEAWPVHKMNLLIEQLFVRYPQYEVVLVGGETDKSFTRQLVFGKRAPVDLIGKTSILELAAFLERCKLFIGNNSGPAHFAALMHIPTIVIFSIKGYPAQWRPWGDNVICLQKKAHEFRAFSDKEIIDSLEEISIDDVLEEVRAIIG
jgi:ADP-heptose:LPS heptosyltransferase